MVLVLCVPRLLLETFNFQGKSGGLNIEFVICHVGFYRNTNKVMGIEANGPHFPSMIEHILNNKNHSQIFMVGLLGEEFGNLLRLPSTSH